VSSLLAANIGNTRVTLGIFRVPCKSAVDPCLVHSCPVPAGPDFAPPLRPAEPVDAAILASVNPSHDKAVAAWITRAFGIRPLRFPEDVPLFLPNRYQPPESAGTDRLANAIAAYDEFHSACIIVDAGTAVTVDAVSADGAFQGGAILPGIELWPVSWATAGTSSRPAATPNASEPCAPRRLSRARTSPCPALPSHTRGTRTHNVPFFSKKLLDAPLLRRV